MKNIVLLLGISLFCYACGGCGTPIDISFAETDKNWFIYKPNQVLIYKNQLGEQRSYYVIVINQVKNVELRATTPTPSCDGSYNIPKQIINLIHTTKRDTIEIHFEQTITSETYISIIENKNRYSMGSLKKIDKLMTWDFDSLKFSVNYILKKVILRDNRAYENSIKLSSSKRNIYYHKTTGIIRFETANGDIWELEN